MEGRKNKKEKKWKTRKRKQPKGLGWMYIPVILALSRLKQKVRSSRRACAIRD